MAAEYDIAETLYWVYILEVTINVLFSAIGEDFWPVIGDWWKAVKWGTSYICYSKSVKPGI